MTTYDATAVSNAAIAHKKGMTLQQGRALRDNPIAMAEGSSGAPKIVSEALDLFVADAAGTYTGLGRVDKVMVMGAVSATSSGGTVTRTASYELSTDGGSTWASGVTVASVSATGTSELPVTNTATGFKLASLGSSHDAIRLSVSGGTIAALGVSGVSP